MTRYVRCSAVVAVVAGETAAADVVVVERNLLKAATLGRAIGLRKDIYIFKSRVAQVVLIL